ncbi:MAG TPA: ribonuclease domain-containing protein [Hydrogenophaga sp.]|uniref:ribonuclease domain-containing protein n=1 Tax=Hydrogenophaga sp. TaxID=1904254 RepID=UPI002C0EA87C|nr:ribonuclease domain-containing protein [Hydrogenophaga sp.]HMN93036.1 ribonuclease domain-containing protein [Hydrogenophaga sp.]HMP09833.1 ribonuclease domain-containing protein [Hydrogenophaga sp.]
MAFWQARGRWKQPRAVIAGVLAAGLLATLGTLAVQARTTSTPVLPGSAIASVPLSGLPVQGREVMAQIREGGPFRYEKDGTVFGNRERLLPLEKRGYYREYTVPTPGLRHRGARRIVCGGQQPRAPDACYYTEDHYSSFRLIVE